MKVDVENVPETDPGSMWIFHEIYKRCHFLSLDGILKPPKGTGFWDLEMTPACICNNDQ